MAVLAGRHHMRIGVTSNGRIRLPTKHTKLNLPQGKWSFRCAFGKWIVWSRDFFPYGIVQFHRFHEIHLFAVWFQSGILPDQLLSVCEISSSRIFSKTRFPAPDLSDKRSHFIMPLEKAVFSPHQMRNQRALNGRERGQRRLLLLVFLEIIPPDEREQHPNGDRYAQLFRWLVLG